ncbi:MAG: hypothetical protein EOO30_20590 [Comamonadaceae bacterium]|nr:MAG: hypothetical protein EOO30_20590 [Comamonadaceae bacterium]
MILAVCAIFLLVPLVWHCRSFDAANASAGAGLLIGAVCGLLGWWKYTWAIGLLCFFLGTFTGFGVACVIGLFYRVLGGGDRASWAPFPSTEPLPPEETKELLAPERGARRWPWALGILALLLLLEVVSLDAPVEWLHEIARAHFAWHPAIERLGRCAPEVQALKSQHNAVMVMFLPLKVWSLYLLVPAWLPTPRGSLPERMWAVFRFGLYILVGIVPAYLLLFVANQPLVHRWTLRELLAPCHLPNWSYVANTFTTSMFAAFCLLPLPVVCAAALKRLGTRSRRG